MLLINYKNCLGNRAVFYYLCKNSYRIKTIELKHDITAEQHQMAVEVLKEHGIEAYSIYEEEPTFVSEEAYHNYMKKKVDKAEKSGRAEFQTKEEMSAEFKRRLNNV